MRFLQAACLLFATVWIATVRIAGPAAFASEGDPATRTSEGAAPAAVERLHDALIDVMKNADDLGYEGRFDRLEPVVLETFDTDFMAEKSVGRHWKKLGQADRERLLATFQNFLVANYAGRFDGWSGQSFETLGEEPGLRETVMVNTRLLDPGNESVLINYRLRLHEGSWQIIDIHLKGTVSELALRRSEYSSLIKRDGFDALMDALDERIASLAAGRDPGSPGSSPLRASAGVGDPS